MNLTPQQKLQILREIESNASLAYVGAMKIVNIELDKVYTAKVKELKEQFEKIVEEMKTKVSLMKPADGKTPKKFEDYFTSREIAEIVNMATEKAKPKKGVDYRDGENYVLTREDKSEIASKIKVPIVEKVIIETPVVREVALKDKPIELAEKLNTLTEKVDKKVIRGLDKWMESIMTSLRDRKKGGGGSGGGGMGNVVPESFSISSATTTVTLASGVASNGRAIWVNYQGQAQAYGTHFTVSGKIVTLLFTPQDSTFLDIIYIRR